MTHHFGVDSYSPHTVESADMLVKANIDWVARYLKNLTYNEVKILLDRKIGILPVWEINTGDYKSGKGSSWGLRAAQTAQALGLQARDYSTAIAVTVDTDLRNPDDIRAAEQYFADFDRVLWNYGYLICGYADGSALEALRAQGLNKSWLAGAFGWSGSRDFLRSGAPDIVQGPTITARRVWPTDTAILYDMGLTQGFPWPTLPFGYDPNIALNDAFGAYRE